MIIFDNFVIFCRFFLYREYRSIRANRLALLGLFFVSSWILIAIFADFLATHSSIIGGDLRTERLQPPSLLHFFGTDGQARDVYSRVIYGSRLTLLSVCIVSFIAAPIGILIGSVSGFLSGTPDRVLMRLVDIFFAFPRFMLALALVMLLGPGIGSAIIAISATLWPAYARIARTEAASSRHADHVAAALLQGIGTCRIIFVHILPLCLSPVLVRVMLDMSGIVIMLGGLGFLGIGVSPPTAEWGMMIASSMHYPIDYWWLSSMPGLAVFTLSFGFILLGDGLGASLDPKARI